MKLLLMLIIILNFYACSSTVEDCICTEEFRSYTVTVIDSDGNPVSDLEITVTSELGKVYEIQQNTNPIAGFEGTYLIMTDEYRQDFEVQPKTIFFKGENNLTTVTAEYLFNTDRCKCHVMKVAGPDTIKVP